MHEWNEQEVRNELYAKVLHMTGPGNQLLKLCEELAELIQASLKLKASLPVQDGILFHDFLWELADVKIMLEQIDFLLNEGRLGCYRPDEGKKILHQKKKDKLSRLAHRVSLGEI